MKPSLLILIIYSLLNASGAPFSTEDLSRARVQGIYTAELGVRELTGKNDGQRVEEYLRQVGLKKGDPWCAAFVCWVFEKADVKHPRTGWSPALFPRSKIIWDRRAAARPGAFVKTKQRPGPQRGDIFGIWFADKHRIAHSGFVDQWDESWLITVEGNTNQAGSREGDGVLKKRRLVKSIYQVASYIKIETL